MSVSPLGVSEQESRSQLNRKYPESIREKAVAMVDRRRLRNPRDRTIFREVAQHFNVGEQSLRLWVRQFDAERLDNGHKSVPAKTNGRQVPENVEAELESLRRKIKKLQAENDVLKRAFVVFSTEWSK
jgi:transposase-like protein